MLTKIIVKRIQEPQPSVGFVVGPINTQRRKMQCCCKGKNNTSCHLKIYDGDILGKQPPLERDGTLVWRSCFYRCCCCREKQPLFSRPLHSLGRITTIGNRGIRGSAIWNGERRAQLHSARQRDWYSIKPRAELAK